MTIIGSTGIPTASFGQENTKKTLDLQLPADYRWVNEEYEDEELWSIRYKGFVGDAIYPDLEIEQSNMLHEHLEMPPQQIAKQITTLIKNYDETAKLTLNKEQNVDGDNCLFYTITTADATYLLFYRQSKTVTHSIEMELSDELRTRHDINMWEEIFFNSTIKD